ncbi:MAG TPA: hypothetical protein VFO58_01620 [Vicinamibacterales bacterium]|nr:hypothetical protein [Vicinamibacterales bacterium]
MPAISPTMTFEKRPQQPFDKAALSLVNGGGAAPEARGGNDPVTEATSFTLRVKPDRRQTHTAFPPDLERRRDH